MKRILGILILLVASAASSQAPAQQVVWQGVANQAIVFVARDSTNTIIGGLGSSGWSVVQGHSGNTLAYDMPSVAEDPLLPGVYYLSVDELEEIPLTNTPSTTPAVSRNLIYKISHAGTLDAYVLVSHRRVVPGR